MKFHVPFTFSGIEKLKKKRLIFRSLIKYKKESKIGFYLEDAEAGITREQYLNICYKHFFISLVFLYIVFTSILAFLSIDLFYLYSLAVSLVICIFMLFSQLIYPKIYASRKQKNVERNLLSALEDMLVQLSSGIPLFTIMVNISSSDYGELSNQFKKIVRKINAGFPQIEVLEEIGEKNSSIFFRRTLWQISNGLKSGSDISIIVRENIKSLNEEQYIQIQNYGNKLNPLIMFYMLVSVILPALSIAFLTIIASVIGLPKTTTITMFIGMFVFVFVMQIMFLGVIKSSRPSLL